MYFAVDSAALSRQSLDTLALQAAVLTYFGDIRVTIEGHADERGTREYNLALGARRAEAVRRHLVALGIAPKRLRTISFGKDRPAVPESGEAAWAKNRRAVSIVE